jgi:L-threonylcarbamoyladenylate synthase
LQTVLSRAEVQDREDLASANAAALERDIAGALEELFRDGLVAFPTETVWGLAARADSEVAVRSLRSWKGREEGQPVSVLVAGPDSLGALGAEIAMPASQLIRDFWPGPLTLVMRCRRELASGVAGSGGALGLRCSTHPVAAALARAVERAGFGPLTATSLNESGREPARDRASARRLCASVARRDVVLLQGEAGGADPSTVVDVMGSEPRLLREGAIPAQALWACIARASGAVSRPEQEESETA